MKYVVLLIGIVTLIIGGNITAVAFSTFSLTPCYFTTTTCNPFGNLGLFAFGGVLSSVGLIVTIIGVIIEVRPRLYGPEVLIQCTNCGTRYPQGTLRCTNCGATL